MPHPQTNQKQPVSLTPQPKKGLLTKIILTLVLILFLNTILIFLSYSYQFIEHQSLISIFLIPTVLSAVAIFLIWHFIGPVEKIVESLSILQKGEFGHKINLKTGDEMDGVADGINYLSHNLELASKQLSHDQNITVSERNKFETIISSILDGIIVLDTTEKVVMANKSALNLTGFSLEELVGKNIRDSISFINEKGEHILPNSHLVHPTSINEPKPSILESPVYLLGKNGLKKQVNLAFSPIVGSINLGSIIILHDLTQEKVFEQMQIDFVSMASHEVRTPLTSVINYLTILSDEAKEKLDAEQKQFLERALISSNQLLELINNLLNVSKIERGTFSLNLKPLDWTARLTQLVEDSKAQAVQKNVSLNIKLPPEPLPQVLADNLRINEVVNNLISNAINYTKEGGWVEVGTMLQGSEILTYIADNGKGIPPESIPHLFKKFFRVPGALEQASKGSGLGLYITKSIIDLHHGKIWIKSEVGKGTMVYFTIPVAENITDHPSIVQLSKTSHL